MPLVLASLCIIIINIHCDLLYSNGQPFKLINHANVSYLNTQLVSLTSTVHHSPLKELKIAQVHVGQYELSKGMIDMSNIFGWQMSTSINVCD
jgi:hypothetical protein